MKAEFTLRRKTKQKYLIMTVSHVSSSHCISLLTANITGQDQEAGRSTWSSDRQNLTRAAGRGVHPSHSYTALGSGETRRCQTQRSAGWHRLNAQPAHISNPPITLLSNMAKRQERRRQWWQQQQRKQPRERSWHWRALCQAQSPKGLSSDYSVK